MTRRARAIFRKELITSFSAFFHFIPVILFSFVSGLFFFLHLSRLKDLADQAGAAGGLIPLYAAQALVHPFFMNMGVVMILLIPTFVMRSFSEERKAGTFELLFTYPVSDFELVLGKWTALLTHFAVLLIPTFVFFGLFGFMKHGADSSAVAVAYLGFFLIAMTLLTIGMFISSLTDNQLVGAAACLVVFGAMWLGGWAIEFSIPASFPLVKELWLIEQLREFSRGILDTRHIAFHFLATGFFFFLTLLIVESRSWRR